jgi:hypothetical protein
MIPQDSRSPFRQQRFLETQNNAGDLSPYNAAQATGATHDDNSGQVPVAVDEPSDEIKLGLILGTGPQTSDSGYENQGTFDFPAMLEYDPADGEPANGELWGPKEGSTLLRKAHPGFICIGDADGHYALFNRDFPKGTIRFKLTATLHLASTAAALLLNEDWTSTGTAITVRDPFIAPGCWMGYTDYEGWAIMGDGGIYDIVWMERPALIIYFTLTQDTNTSSGTTATFTTYFQQGDKSRGGSGLVYDVQSLYPRAKTGAKGIAIWNDRTERYEVVVCQQLGFIFKATATTFCPDSTDVTISGFARLNHSLYNQVPDPVPTTAYNRHGLAGRDGDSLTLAFDDVNDRYDIIQCTPHLLKNYDEFRFYRTESGCELQGKGKKFYAYNCNEVFDWETMGAFSGIDVVENVVLSGGQLLQSVVHIYVPCYDEPFTEVIDTTTTCTSSGSS